MTTTSVERLEGEDKFGRFVIRIALRHCDVCGRACWATVGYGSSASLPEGVRIGDTILGDWGGWTGIDCGCYGKFHRQVAHTVDGTSS